MSKTKKRRHHSSETKTQAFWRSFFAFLLFLSLTATALFTCILTNFVNDSSIIKLFTDSEYISSMQQDIVRYGYDTADAANIPSDSVDSVITYDSVARIEKAFVAGSLGAGEEYTPTTYLDYIDKLKEELDDSTQDMLNAYNIEIDENAENATEKYADQIINYLKKKIEFKYMDRLSSVTNLGKTVSIGGIVVFALLSIVFILIVISIGSKKYRSIRELSYSLSASGIMCFVLILGVRLVGHFKSLVLYPAYLSDAVMKYVERCMMSVGVAGGILLALSLLLAITVWRIKHDKSS